MLSSSMWKSMSRSSCRTNNYRLQSGITFKCIQSAQHIIQLTHKDSRKMITDKQPTWSNLPFDMLIGYLHSLCWSGHTDLVRSWLVDFCIAKCDKQSAAHSTSTKTILQRTERTNWTTNAERIRVEPAINIEKANTPLLDPIKNRIAVVYQLQTH